MKEAIGRTVLSCFVKAPLPQLPSRVRLTPNKAYLLAVLLIILGVFNGSFGVSAESASNSCVCGVDRVPCEKNLTSSDCPNGRVIARRDCSCCFVCAKQLTEECNNIDALCDSDYGLECGSDKRCKAKIQCSDDTTCTSDLMCVGGACADPCKVLPDVCREANMTSGICVARNHRALCSCPPGTALNSNKECISSSEEVKKCESDGRQMETGDKVYKEKCGKVCECEASGQLQCQDVQGDPDCKSGFVPMSKITGEMSEACKILVGNDTLFDGCCVPDTCKSIKSQDNPSELLSQTSNTKIGARDFKLAESHNNLGEEDEKTKLKVETTKEMGEGASASGANPKEMIKETDGLMQVTVLKRSDHSAVVDLPKNDKEAILSISLSQELMKNPGSAEVWKEHRIPAGLPQITLSDLLPNTSYTLKYIVGGKDYPAVQFITDEVKKETMSSSAEVPSSASSEMEDSTEMDHGLSDEMGSTAASSEVNGSGSEEATTHPGSAVGCLYNRTSYEIGEVFYQGCDERCECMKNGEVKCMERCSIPLFKKGAFAHDKMCYEEPSGIDDCCVIIACARGSGGAAGEPRELISILPQPCDTVKCGLNAHCLGPSGMLSDEEQQTNQTLCVCNEGFLGDPYDEAQGCQQNANATPTAPSEASPTSPSIPTPSSTVKPEWCVFKNKTYEFGAEQFDGCNYKCRCETSGEFLCVPRCNYRRDEEKEIPAGCEVQKDPSDLECCEMLVCHGQPLESGTRKDAPTVPNDGCVYKNKTYARDEKFHDGCDHQCMCFSNGDVTCQPRCPPSSASPNGQDDCVTLPDPTDKCCTVTLCGNSTLSDVMKAANETGEMFQSDIHTTTKISPHDITTMKPEESVTLIPAMAEGRSTVFQESPVSLRISMIHPLNDSTIMVSVQVMGEDLTSMASKELTVNYSQDLKSWKNYTANIKDLIQQGSDELQIAIPGLLPGKEYYFKAKINGSESNTASGFTRGISMPSSMEEDEFGSFESSASASQELDMSSEGGMSSFSSGEKIPCSYKGKTYEFAQEFYDECDAYCMCDGGGEVKCVQIDCPKDGLELLDETCLKWEPDTKNFRKEAPSCCPQMECVQHSSCMVEGHEGLILRNFEEVPQKITGCDKRCHCEYGNITCQNLCPPMTQHPPPDLPCPHEVARAVTLPHNECCYQWVCPHPQELLNNTNGSKTQITLEPTMLNKTETQIPSDLINVNQTLTRPPYENGSHDSYSPFGHSHEHNEEHDQFVPPSTGNQPTLVSLDKINPQQLQELLHQLSSIGEGEQGSNNQYTHAGTYVQVHTPQQVKELEKDVGAKFVEQAEDGSYILVIPNAVPNFQDQTYSDHHLGQGHGPPYTQAAPPAGFPGADQYPFGLSPFQRPHPGALDRSKVSNIVIHPLNESTLQIDFTVSPIIVGLQGHVEVLYTSEFAHKPNPAQWDRKVFQQAEDLIDNTHLQLFLMSLQPDTEYHMQIKVVVAQAGIHPTSDIMRVRTPPPPLPTTTLPPEILVDPEIQLTATESKSVKLHWRKFTEMEKDLIDGVQITYKAIDEKVYSTTPLLHRSLTEYELEDLQSDKEYEINLLFIPFDTNQSTVLKSQKPIFIKTTPAEDEYNFDIAITNGKITESTAELVMDGIPHPEDKFVNIYQVIYMSGDQKEQKSYFKVPKRETSKKATLQDLKPGTNYTLWLEAFLTNGKKKRSNVISIKTKDGPLPQPEKSGQQNQLHDPRASEQLPQTTSYYGALVALAIVAALSIIGIIALLMILIKKQNYAKAPINDRKSESSYDNPSFKSYDVESNGHIKPGDL